MAQGRCGGSVEMWWLRGHVVTQGRCGDSGEMWWLRGDVVTQGRWGDSVVSAPDF